MLNYQRVETSVSCRFSTAVNSPRSTGPLGNFPHRLKEDSEKLRRRQQTEGQLRQEVEKLGEVPFFFGVHPENHGKFDEEYILSLWIQVSS